MTGHHGNPLLLFLQRHAEVHCNVQVHELTSGILRSGSVEEAETRAVVRERVRRSVIRDRTSDTRVRTRIVARTAKDTAFYLLEVLSLFIGHVVDVLLGV